MLVWLGWISILGAREVDAQGERNGTGTADGVRGAGGDSPNGGSGNDNAGPSTNNNGDEDRNRGGNSSGGRFGGGRRRFGNRFRNVSLAPSNSPSSLHHSRATKGRKGGRFRNGGTNDGQQQQDGSQATTNAPDQGATELAQGDTDTNTSPSLSSTTPPAPSTTSIPAPTAASLEVPLETPSSGPLIASFEPPTSIADAFPGPLLTSTLEPLSSSSISLAGIPSIAPTPTTIVLPLSSPFSPEPPPTLPTSRLTLTISSTIYITSPTPAPASLPTSPPPPDTALAPLPSSAPHHRLSPGAQAALGIGISLAVLLAIGAATWAASLRRRRQHAALGQRLPSSAGSESSTPRTRGLTAGRMFGLGAGEKKDPRVRRGDDGADEAEWSVQEASTLEVRAVRGGSVRSVGSDGQAQIQMSAAQGSTEPPGKAGEGDGSHGSARDTGLAGMALGSHPPAAPVSPSAFPEPPLGRERMGRWPLVE